MRGGRERHEPGRQREPLRGLREAHHLGIWLQTESLGKRPRRRFIGGGPGPVPLPAQTKQNFSGARTGWIRLSTRYGEMFIEDELLCEEEETTCEEVELAPEPDEETEEEMLPLS